MDNEWLEGASLCEREGLARSATVLRIAAMRESFRAFVIFERTLATRHYCDNDRKFYLSSNGVPIGLFAEKGHADLASAELNLEAIRKRNIINHLHSIHSFSWCLKGPRENLVAGFEAEVGKILGVPFQILGKKKTDFADLVDLPPMFPSWATDEQIREIAKLFDEPFFFVKEVCFSDLASSLGDRS